MCLTKITNWYKKDSGIGWKVFIVDKKTKKLRFPYYRGKINVGVWVKDKRGFVYDFNGERKYERGFHIFKDKEDADTFSELVRRDDEIIDVRKVKYKSVICSGDISSYYKKCVVVAKEMYVIPKKGDKNESNS